MLMNEVVNSHRYSNINFSIIKLRQFKINIVYSFVIWTYIGNCDASIQYTVDLIVKCIVNKEQLTEINLFIFGLL